LKDLGYDIEAAGFLAIFGPKGLPDMSKRDWRKSSHGLFVILPWEKLIENTGSSLFIRGSIEFGKYLEAVGAQSKKEFKELGLGIYGKEKK